MRCTCEAMAGGNELTLPLPRMWRTAVAPHLRLDKLAQVGRVRVHRRLACHRAERAAEGGFVAALCLGVAPLRRLRLRALGGAVEGDAFGRRGRG